MTPGQNKKTHSITSKKKCLLQLVFSWITLLTFTRVSFLLFLKLYLEKRDRNVTSVLDPSPSMSLLRHRERPGDAAGVLPDRGRVCPQTSEADGGETGDGEEDEATAGYTGEAGREQWRSYRWAAGCGPTHLSSHGCSSLGLVSHLTSIQSSRLTLCSSAANTDPVCVWPQWPNLCWCVQVAALQAQLEQSRRSVVDLKRHRRRVTSDLQDARVLTDSLQSRIHDLERKRRRSVLAVISTWHSVWAVKGQSVCWLLSRTECYSRNSFTVRKRSRLVLKWAGRNH